MSGKGINARYKNNNDFSLQLIDVCPIADVYYLKFKTLSELNTGLIKSYLVANLIFRRFWF